MGELKKTFVAGFAVLIILLLAPYYLEWIGYNDVQTSSQEITTEAILPSAETLYPNIPTAQTTQNPVAKNIKNINEESITIHTSLYTAIISNTGGGSLKHYRLKNYYGAWENGVYVDSINVTLLSSSEQGCAPCIGSNNRTFDLPFECSTSMGWKNNKNLYLPENESIEIVCSYVDEGGKDYTKITKK